MSMVGTQRYYYNAASIFSIEYQVKSQEGQLLNCYTSENHGLPKVEIMLLKGFNLIPININNAILSYDLGITVFVKKEKKLFSLPILRSLIY